MRALITGGYGFAGRHLAHYLISCGDDVALSYQPGSKDELVLASKNSERGVAVPTAVQSLALDITNRKSVFDLIQLLKPDIIYHLAGITFVPEAEGALDSTFQTNFFGTVNLLDAIAKESKETRFLFVGTSEIYGDPRPGTLPLTELTPARPVSVYGLSKAAADLAAFRYSHSENLFIVRARPFNHIGPGQQDRFAISSFAKQLAEIKLGRSEPTIKVGNLEAKRDYSDVSDIVRGYREVILNGKRGEVYNLCSGVSTAVGEILKKLIKVAEVETTVEVDPERVRPIDIPEVVGSNQKAQKEIGWKPRIDLEATLHSLFAYWLEVLSVSKR